MEIYKVLVGGRDCMKHPDGKLKEGDYIHPYGMFMVKVATPTSPYRTTSMFFDEVLDPVKWKNESHYRKATLEEIRKLIPHLTSGKKFSCIRNFKKEAQGYVEKEESKVVEKVVVEKPKKKRTLSEFVSWLNSMTTTELIKEFPGQFHDLRVGDSQSSTVTRILANDAILWQMVKEYNKKLLRDEDE